MITPEDVHGDGDGDGMVAVIPGEVMAKAMRDGVCPGSGGAPLLAEDYNSRAFNWEYYINIVEKSVNCILPDTFKNFSLETVTLGSMPNLEMIYTYAFRGTSTPPEHACTAQCARVHHPSLSLSLSSSLPLPLSLSLSLCL